MNALYRILSGMDFALELLLAAVLMILPLEKKPRWQPRLAAGFAGCFLLSFLCQYVTSPLNIGFNFYSSSFPISVELLLLAVGWVLYMIFYLGQAVFLFRFCTQLSMVDAVYGAFCAYAVQHLVHSIALFLFPEALRMGQTMPPAILPVKLLIDAAVYGLFYRFAALRLPRGGRYEADVRYTLSTAVMVTMVAAVLNLSAKLLYTRGNAGLFRVCMLYDLGCCLFLLWLQVSRQKQARLQAEVLLERRLRARQSEQYAMTRESIALVNRKCHDLKHQVAALRQEPDRAKRSASLDRLERSVMIYDSVVTTGNEVLDTLLTERSLLCESEQIQWTCMADGEILRFMDPVDLYTLFGNALDNAVEYLRTVKDPAKRVLSVTLQKQGELAFLLIENYCEQAPVFEDGLPRTTKEDPSEHGYGTRSIRAIVEQYGGTMQPEYAEQAFLLKVLLPIPANS